MFGVIPADVQSSLVSRAIRDRVVRFVRCVDVNGADAIAVACQTLGERLLFCRLHSDCRGHSAIREIRDALDSRGMWVCCLTLAISACFATLSSGFEGCRSVLLPSCRIHPDP